MQPSRAALRKWRGFFLAGPKSRSSFFAAHSCMRRAFLASNSASWSLKPASSQCSMATMEWSSVASDSSAWMASTQRSTASLYDLRSRSKSRFSMNVNLALRRTGVNGQGRDFIRVLRCGRNLGAGCGLSCAPFPLTPSLRCSPAPSFPAFKEFLARADGKG